MKHQPKRALRAAATIAVVFVARATAQPPAVVVKTINDDAIEGRLRSFSLQGGLELEPLGPDLTTPGRIAAEDVVHIATRSPRETSDARLFQVILNNGDCLLGRPAGFTGDAVRFAASSVGTVELPLERVSGWRNPVASDNAWRDRVDSLLARQGGSDDRVLLTNGDVLAGIVTAIDNKGFRFERASEALSIEHKRVVAAAIVALPAGETSGLTARVHLADGSRITANALRWSESGIVATVWAGVKLSVDAPNIACVDMLGGRWAWLSDLQPVSVEQTGMMSLHWPHRAERNVLGGPLRVDGREFERGIGVHSRSVLAFDLSGRYSEFVTSYGIDDDSGAMADVAVAIRVDDRTIHRRESVRRGSLHGPLRLDVTGGRRLELIVDFGRHAAVQDRFNWIEPALVRQR